MGSAAPAGHGRVARRVGYVIPFLAFAPEVRRVIYTTNAIEALNRQLRKAVKTKGHFPSEDAARKLSTSPPQRRAAVDPHSGVDQGATRVQDPLRRPATRLNPPTQLVGHPRQGLVVTFFGGCDRSGRDRAGRQIASGEVDLGWVVARSHCLCGIWSAGIVAGSCRRGRRWWWMMPRSSTYSRRVTAPTPGSTGDTI